MNTRNIQFSFNSVANKIVDKSLGTKLRVSDPLNYLLPQGRPNFF